MTSETSINGSAAAAAAAANVLPTAPHAKQHALSCLFAASELPYSQWTSGQRCSGGTGSTVMSGGGSTDLINRNKRHDKRLD